MKFSKCKTHDIHHVRKESRDKTCSKMEKTWFLLVDWVVKNSKMNEKI